MQFQADMLQGNVVRSNIEEISALGATLLAGLAVGLWNDLDEIEALRKVDKTFSPIQSTESTNALYEGWKKAVVKL